MLTESSTTSTSGHLDEMKGILRHKYEVKWDEMSILITDPTAKKDYGYVKINKQPFPPEIIVSSSPKTIINI